MPPIYPSTADIEGMSATRAVGPYGMVVPPAPLMPPPMTFNQQYDELDLGPDLVCHIDGCNERGFLTCSR